MIESAETDAQQQRVKTIQAALYAIAVIAHRAGYANDRDRAKQSR